ncbi:hypothetical protein Noc_1941 [Nitrosococcus oceani ATCC 19707]|uniref:Uncharacterized protein n=1 Tax=Nitrosococcus oceani (strain ATCC 19707 / BCRC 17464 / JCM 30415 / NCIMB 11848 / C-107) TaxID=323261 RepID=Q3J9U3_NITOC|nr:hypothetical protein [Nitrosococcus oceani]ABA58403.1 hypothetical protein Noc_1941 [Nitrosococcus oceani ATCC 19707]GEM18798.1 hypothetical protein NONS58_01590 [Nitrosococcus oceani]
MKFRMQMNGALPRLAWCARLERGSEVVTVEHGPWVESQEDFFFEGGWAGPYDRRGLLGAKTVLGSGAVLSDDQVVFIPSSHTLERLHFCRDGDCLFVSNSFIYLLAALDDEIDPMHVEYELEFLSVVKGYHRARKWVPTAQGRRIQLQYYRRLRIDCDLNIYTDSPPALPHFGTYEDYVGYLEGTMQQVLGNASDSRRSITYKPLATVSTGYDSPACAVIARKCGGTEAVTFCSARMEFNGDVGNPQDACDDGGKIGRQLGFNVMEFDRSLYFEDKGIPEAEFLATGNGGDDVVMSVLAEHLPGTVFFTGFRGDTIWDFEPQAIEDSAQFKSKDPSGASLGEFRLRLGFIHAPLPVLTMPRHDEILRISQSPEMDPWRLGNTYDRPIPRRLAESAGIEREAFGQEKKAITQPFWVTLDNGAMLSAGSHQALMAFSEELESRNRQSMRHRLRRMQATLYHWIVWRGNNLGLPLRMPISLRLLISQTGYKFHWAVAQLRDRYRPTMIGLRDPTSILAMAPAASKVASHGSN